MANLKQPINVIKYIKFPDRRLVSGFLTVNVVSHNDNDSYDDANQYYYDNWASQPSQIKNPIQPFNNTQPTDFGRAGYKHTFGDYDCLLFWVAGGMTLHAPSFSSKLSQSQLASSGFISSASGPATWTDTGLAFSSSENWHSTVTHPCQHFLKSHLIGRINNGYGHTSTNYYKNRAIVKNSFEYGTSETSDWNQDITAISTEGNPHSTNRAGLHPHYILSNGTFSNDSDGDFVEDLSTPGNNTYFPVVEGVEIYGKHNFTIPKHSDTSGDPSTGNFVYTSGNTTVGNYAHEDTFWSMVIKIKIKAYDSVTGTGATDGDTEFFKSRTNVMFQPFGETASFDIANSLHT